MPPAVANEGRNISVAGLGCPWRIGSNSHEVAIVEPSRNFVDTRYPSSPTGSREYMR